MKGRQKRELEAEAKYYNSIVTGESSDDRPFKPKSEEWLTNKIFKKALSDSRYQIQVTAATVDESPGMDESTVSIVYRRYLGAFRDNNKLNPAYSGSQRALSPDAVNKLMKLKQGKE